MVAQSEKPNVLFVPAHPSSMPDMFCVAQGIAHIANSVFWFGSASAGEYSWRDSVEEQGYTVIHIPDPPDRIEMKNGHSGLVGTEPIVPQSSRLKRIIKHQLPAASQLYWTWKRYRPLGRVQKLHSQIKIFDKVIEQFNPSAILLKLDVGTSRILAARARRFKIPILIVPSASSRFTSSTFLLSLGIQSTGGAHRFACSGRDAPLLNRAVAALHPEITYHHDAQVYINSNPMEIIIEKVFGVYPNNPWHLGGSKSSFLALGGAADWERYRSYGVDESRLVLTGQVVHDELHQALQQARERPRGTLPLVLYGASPFPEHGYLSWQEHLETMRQILSILKQTPCTLRLCLHPNHDPSRYLELAREMNIAVEQRPLLRVLPEADVYLTWFSSTIPWAVILGVPVINLDIYDKVNLRSMVAQDFIDYSTIGGVVNVKTLQEMAKALGRVLNDEQYRQQLDASRKRYVRENALLDGRCGERLVSVVLDMIEGRRPRLAGMKIAVAQE